MEARWETGPEHDNAHPFLILPRVPRPYAVALILHGGTEHSTTKTRKWEPALMRMLPFAQHIEARSVGRIGAAILRNAVRGYNEVDRCPMRDAEWALERLRQRYHDLLLALVGHSMGGRVALELAASPGVRSVVGLAPWIPQQYDVEPFLNRQTLLMHGQLDTMTDPSSSEELARRIAVAGGDATFESMSGSHTMLWLPGRWHRYTTNFLRRTMLTK